MPARAIFSTTHQQALRRLFLNGSVVAWVAAAIIWSGLISSRAFASSSKPTAVSSLHAAADKVAEGRVIAQSARWEKGRIVTRSLFSVRECFKGKCGAELEIKQFGGSLGGLTMVAHGVSLLRQGDSALLFLAADGPASHQPIGLGKGVVRTGTGHDATVLRSKLRSLKNHP